MKWRVWKPTIRNQRDALIWVGGVTVVIAAILYLAPHGVERSKEHGNSVVLDVMPVKVAPSRIAIHADGVARPESEIPLVAEVSGRVMEVNENFVSGATVNSDVVLAKVDPEPYELALAQRRNEVSGASLHLADTKARASVAQRVSGKHATDYARMVPHLAEAQTRLEAAKAALPAQHSGQGWPVCHRRPVARLSLYSQ